MNAVWPAGYGLIEFAEIDSTNDEARRRADANDAAPLWIRADRQTKGRGRRGRGWETPGGNLAATLLLRPERPAAECAQLSFVAALAAAEAVATYTDGVAVKWPNDVLARGAKIAGILLESAGSRVPHYLAVGIGINLAHHPEGTPYPATSLAGLGAVVPSAGDALVALASAFAAWYERWRTEGFAPVREAWLERAARLGGTVVARLPEEEVRGLFEGLDEHGALLLRQTDGLVRAITAADIFF